MQSGGMDSRGLKSALLYSSLSISMVLLNKAVATSFGSPIMLIFTQNLIGMLVYGLAIAAGKWQVELSSKKAMKVSTLNLLFVAMLVTSMKAMARLPVAMVTVLKNLNNFIIVGGDVYLYGNMPSQSMMVALLLMLVGAVMAAANDLQFDAGGYAWMALNCIFCSAYTLSVRSVKDATGLSSAAMSFYNSAISLPILLTYATVVGDISQWTGDVFGGSVSSFTMLILSGAVGTSLGASVFWCVTCTSASTASFVGTLNKIPITLLGSLFFGSTLDANAYIFVAMNLLGALVFVYGKVMKRKGTNSNVQMAKMKSGSSAESA
eukprot:g2401.t1